MSDNNLSPEDQIIQMERTWVQAHRDLDLAAIEAILDDDYAQLKTDGTIISKRDLLESYASGTRYWEIAESEPLHIQVLAEVAVFYGRWRSKGVNNGVPFDYSTSFIAVYRQYGNEWKLVADASL